MVEKQEQKKNAQKEAKVEQKQAKEAAKAVAPNKEELLDMLKRTQANFENYRKQTEKRIEDIRALANKQAMIQLLPVYDNLLLSLKNVNSHEEFVQGVRLIADQFMAALASQGIEEIKIEKGSPFDPHMHEALMKIPSEQPEDAVLEVLQKGFTLHGKVIRHARVKLSAGKKE